MRRKRLAAAGCAMAMVAALGGCGLFGEAAESSPASSGSLEETTIKVAELKIIDATPIHIAIDNGHFKAEGLNVELSTGGKGSVNIDNIIGGIESPSIQPVGAVTSGHERN